MVTVLVDVFNLTGNKHRIQIIPNLYPVSSNNTALVDALAVTGSKLLYQNRRRGRYTGVLKRVWLARPPLLACFSSERKHNLRMFSRFKLLLEEHATGWRSLEKMFGNRIGGMMKSSSKPTLLRRGRQHGCFFSSFSFPVRKYNISGWMKTRANKIPVASAIEIRENE